MVRTELVLERKLRFPPKIAVSPPSPASGKDRTDRLTLGQTRKQPHRQAKKRKEKKRKFYPFFGSLTMASSIFFVSTVLLFWSLFAAGKFVENPFHFVIVVVVVVHCL